jgi:hypothetical protein
MTVLAVTIPNPTPALDTKKAEVAYMRKVLEQVGHDLQAGMGNVTTGTTKGAGSDGTPNTTTANWTYTPTATKP